MQLSKQGLEALYKAVIDQIVWGCYTTEETEKWCDVSYWLYLCLEGEECLWKESMK